jgi:23S rRNA pseudouridine2604 synthase
METRINKYIAESGLCSRRAAETYIKKGIVTINGKVAPLGAKVKTGDIVKINSQIIKPSDTKVYIIFNKPVGVITTTNQDYSNNVMEYVHTEERVFPVGRLDVESSGLMLLTNDGDLSNSLSKGKGECEKEYVVTVDKTVNGIFLKKLSAGVVLDGYRTLPAKASQIGSKSFSLVILEGKNRQIRRMCEFFGYNVIKLERIRIGEIKLEGLKSRKWRYLQEKEVESLKSKTIK